MSIELNTLAPKKWVADYSGARPTLDSSDNVLVGDFAIDNSTTPYAVWYCESNTLGSPLWTRVQKIDVTTVSTTPYAALATDTMILVNCSGGARTINLPAASGLTGKVYYIKKIDSSTNAITVDGNASEVIDGELTQTITGQYTSMSIVCDGSGWNIF